MTRSEFVSSKWIAWATHFLVWVCILMFPLLINRPMTPMPDPARPTSLGFPTMLLLTLVVNFYMTAYWLVPRFLNRQSWPRFLLATLSVWILLSGTNLLAVALTFENRRGIPYLPLMMPFFPLFLSSACGIAFRMIGDNFKFKKRIQEIESEKLKTELSFLRSQINPHFLFNTLNILVALARKKSDLLESSILRLSGLLHYMLYESNEDKIGIEKEIEYLDNYIDLQRLRLGEAAGIEMKITVPENSSMTIPPMLFIPFVENAIKHGTGPFNKPKIEIDFSVVDHVLLFHITNTVYATDAQSPPDSGIGLMNVRRRLELIYPDKHELSVTQTEQKFGVQLKIELV
jgi:two-component system, LytTR family, sensor kinase